MTAGVEEGIPNERAAVDGCSARNAPPARVTALRATFVYPTLTVGGAERQLALLAPALRERGIDSTIVTLKHEGRFFHELRDAGFPVFFAAMRSRADVRGARRAAATVRRAAPDIVVTQSVDAQVIGHGIARWLGVPHLTIEHGGPGLRRAPHRRVLVRLVAPHVDRVVAIAAAQVPTLRSSGFRADGIVVIPNGSPEPTSSVPATWCGQSSGSNPATRSPCSRRRCGPRSARPSSWRPLHGPAHGCRHSRASSRAGGPISRRRGRVRPRWEGRSCSESATTSRT